VLSAAKPLNMNTRKAYTLSIVTSAGFSHAKSEVEGLNQETIDLDLLDNVPSITIRPVKESSKSVQ